MNILDRIIGSNEYRSQLANPDQWLIDALGAPATFSGQKVNQEKALGLSTFRSAVELVSETVGLLPLKVYRVDTDGNKFEARNHRTWRMLNEKPNPITSAHRFWATATSHLRVHGNVFIEKLRGSSGLVEELWLREPQFMRVEWDDGLKRRRFIEEGNYGKRTWDDDRMLHIAGWGMNGITGDSTLHRGRNTIGNAIAREEFEGSFYKRGATLASVIEHPGRLGDVASKRLRDYFAKFYGGSARAHGTPIIEEGATLKTVGTNLVDLEFEAAQARTRTEIAVMFNIPPSFLGGSTGDSLTYATVEANMVQYMTLAVSPLTSTIAKALSADPSLFPFPSWFAEFVLDGMLRGDSKSRAEFYQIMAGIGALEVNEIRAMENREPLEEEPEKPATPAEDAPVVDALGEPVVVEA